MRWICCTKYGHIIAPNSPCYVPRSKALSYLEEELEILRQFVNQQFLYEISLAHINSPTVKIVRNSTNTMAAVVMFTLK